MTSLGLHQPFFTPEKAGRNYKPLRYLKTIDDLRDQLTVFSGVSHPEVDGGPRWPLPSFQASNNCRNRALRRPAKAITF